MPTRIPGLTTITGASIAADDKFVVYDASTDTTKAFTRTELANLIANILSPSVVLSKLLTVDGPGSLVDADTLDGTQLAAIALLSGAAFTGNVSVGGNLTVDFITTLEKTLVSELTARIGYEDISGSTTLTAGHANRQLFANNNLTLPSGVFSKGDWIVLNSQGTARFSRGSGLTMYFDGTNVAEVWVYAYRSAVAIFDSATVCRVIGGTTSPPP